MKPIMIALALATASAATAPAFAMDNPGVESRKKIEKLWEQTRAKSAMKAEMKAEMAGEKSDRVMAFSFSDLFGGAKKN